jgi:hypothetical protein
VDSGSGNGHTVWVYVLFAVKSARILAVFLGCLGSQGAQPEAYVDRILCCGFPVTQKHRFSEAKAPNFSAFRTISL